MSSITPQALPIDPRNRQIDRFSAKLYLTLCVAIAIGMAAVMMAAEFRDIPVTRFLRDPAAEFGFSPLAGIFSHLGVMAMVSTAAICGFSAWVGTARKRLLTGVAAFSGYFALDDLFMLHESVLPRIGVPETLVVGLIGLAALAILAGLGRAAWAPGICLALALMGGSAVADHLIAFSAASTVLEDGLKLMGLLCWALFWIGLSRTTVGSEMAK